MVSALYPGSFDPVTCGHLDLVERGLSLFDGVTVAVAENISKQPVFSLEERLALLREVLPSDPRVQITSFRGLVVDFCRQHGFRVVLRGLRTVSDFEYEYQMALTNRHMLPEVETVFVMPSVRYSFISSTLIKDIVRHGGDVSDFLPPAVEKLLRTRLAQSAPAPSRPKEKT
jgi:pantetheine-phosphate adenylyltransferase